VSRKYVYFAILRYQKKDNMLLLILILIWGRGLEKDRLTEAPAIPPPFSRGKENCAGERGDKAGRPRFQPPGLKSPPRTEC